MEIGVDVWEGKVMTAGSKGGSGADVALWREKAVYAVCFVWYLSEQSFVGSDYKLVYVEGWVTKAAFECFVEKGIASKQVSFYL